MQLPDSQLAVISISAVGLLILLVILATTLTSLRRSRVRRADRPLGPRPVDSEVARLKADITSQRAERRFQAASPPPDAPASPINDLVTIMIEPETGLTQEQRIIHRIIAHLKQDMADPIEMGSSPDHTSDPHTNNSHIGTVPTG